jgi:hypothetical protein
VFTATVVLFWTHLIWNEVGCLQVNTVSHKSYNRIKYFQGYKKKEHLPHKNLSHCFRTKIKKEIWKFDSNFQYRQYRKNNVSEYICTVLDVTGISIPWIGGGFNLKPPLFCKLQKPTTFTTIIGYLVIKVVGLCNFVYYYEVRKFLKYC